MTNTTTRSATYKRRPLEELNLIDDFLFQQLLMQEEDGEALDAEIIPDIYDVEPNNTYEKKTLPKRMRYYHGLIDTQLLDSGIEYDKLPNVVIIIILPYDPFGKNRMVYTIQNQCVEDATVPYNDGAKKIFLYTKGTEGKPSQELCDMLKYIENTTVDNITNQNIDTIHHIVKRVKSRKEVGINYMKSWELEKMYREQAREEGLAEGLAEGLEKGLAEGREEGRTEGIISFIKSCHALNILKADVLTQLRRNFDLTEVDGKAYIESYWDDIQ